MPAVPDIPTVAESGYKGFETTTWFGILVPAKTPAPIIGKLSAAVTKVFDAPDVKERMTANGGATVKPGPTEFAALIKRDLDKWRKVVREAGIKPD